MRPVTIEDTRVVTHEAATTNSVSASSSVGDAAREAVVCANCGWPREKHYSDGRARYCTNPHHWLDGDPPTFQPAPTAPPPAAPPEVQDTKRALLAKLRAIQSCAKDDDVFGALDDAARFAWEAEALFDKLCAPVAAAPSEEPYYRAIHDVTCSYRRHGPPYPCSCNEAEAVREEAHRRDLYYDPNLYRAYSIGRQTSEREMASVRDLVDELRARLATAEAERDRLRGAASDAAEVLEAESRHADHRADDMAEEYEIGPAYHAERDRAHRYLAIAAKLRTPAPSTGTTP